MVDNDHVYDNIFGFASSPMTTSNFSVLNLKAEICELLVAEQAKQEITSMDEGQFKAEYSDHKPVYVDVVLKRA